MGTLKRIAKAVLPAQALEALRKIRANKDYSPEWNMIQNGFLKGSRMFFDPSGTWQKRMISGTYDSFIFDRIAALHPDKKIIYDIGAHIGFHALTFAKLVGEEGVVAAFEPNTANYERLITNISGNPDLSGRIRPFNVAVSDNTGHMKFTTKNDVESGRSMGGFLEAANTHWERSAYDQRGFSATSVESVPVDSMRQRFDLTLPDIIKIDVEGAECQVLEGAKQTISEKRPEMFIEVHSIKSMFDVMAFLASASYTSTIINKEPSGICFIHATTINADTHR